MDRELMRLELLELRKQQKDNDALRKHLEEECKRLENEEQRMEQEPTPRSDAAKRKSLSRAFKGFPDNPVLFADTLVKVCDKAAKSPRKRKELKNQGLDVAHREVNSAIGKSIEDQLASIRKSKKKADIEKKREIVSMMGVLRKYRLQSTASRRFGVSTHTIRKGIHPKQKKHKRSTPQSTKDAVAAFLEDAAIQLPDKKYISKKTLKKTGFLQEPISAVYSRFRESHPNIKIGLKKFYMLRPAHIKTLGSMKYRGCLCEYYTNIDLKVAAINNVAHKERKQSKFQGVYGVARVTMCHKEGKFNKRCCIERRCEECGTRKLEEHLHDLITSQGERPITWKRWEKKVTKQDGSTVSRQVVSSKDGTMKECIAELAKESEQIAAHLFTAAWQNQQFSDVTKNLPAGSVIMVLDFAENYTCQYQDEVQSAHWYHSNATVHPIVTYYACPICGTTMQESIVFISPDKTHDYHAVENFMQIAVTHLQDKLGAGAMKQIVRFSDGCGAQYKSRGPFFDVSCAEDKYGVKVRHEFFGSRHGKGPSDGESAVVKRQASNAVLGGKTIINDARGLFEFCQSDVTKKPSAEGECLHFQRVFFYVDDIDRNRGHTDINLRTVKGTRLVHSVKGIRSGQISTKNLSCFCPPCTHGNGAGCQNAAYVDAWKDASVCDGPIFTRPAKDSRVFPRETANSASLDQDAAATRRDSASVTDSEAFPSETATSASLDQDAVATTRVDPYDVVPPDNLPVNASALIHSKIEVNSYVAVKFELPGKKNKTPIIYMALVQERNGDLLTLKFMRRNQSGTYYWPEEEEHIQPVEDVVAVLSPPSLVPGRALLFDFNKEFNDLKNTVKAIFK